MTIANELRAETARILARHFNSVPDSIAAIRVSTVQRIAEYVEQAEARTCRCQDQRGFEIDTRRHNGPLDAQLTLERFRRMAREEEPLT